MLTRQYWGDLPLSSVTFNEVQGDVGELTAVLRPSVVLDADERRELDRLVSFDRAWLCACWGQAIPWSGHIQAGPWVSGTHFAVVATEAVGWLYEVHVGRSRTRHAWRGVEQHRIVRELVALVTNQPGAPRIVPDTAVSGVARDLTAEPQSFTVVGDAIDSMAGRDRGFDWGVSTRYSRQDGRPELYLWQAHPERDRGAAPSIELVSHPRVGNILGRPELPRDAVGRRTVVYATGEGEAPDMMVAADVDPLVNANLALRRETTLSLSGSGITNQSTLAEHARAERAASAYALGTLDIDVLAADPDFTTYGAGSRVALSVRDEYHQVRHPAVRVLERTVRCERPGLADEVTLTLDMADTEPADGVAL